MTKKILLKNKLQAILIKKKDLSKSKGINFFTSNKLPFQIASMKHKKGHKISAHIHQKFLRKIYSTSEALIVFKGSIKVNFYNQKNIIFKNLLIKAGDIILFFQGSHGFEIKKDAHFVEVKQGPYFKKMDKKLIK